MNKKIVVISVLLLAAVAVWMVARDLLNDHPRRSTGNPYELGMDSFRQVDPALVRYKEYRQIKLGMENPTGIALLGERMFMTGDRRLLVVSTGGEMLGEYELENQPSCINLAGQEKLCIGFRDHFGLYRTDGTRIMQSDVHSDASVFTAIAVRDDKVFIADAGNRRVLVYDTGGNFRKEIRGETGDGTSHGFIIPSPNFHLDFSPEGKLWVANPGVHTLQQYTEDGIVQGSWSKASLKIDGFSGCCNPARFAFLPDGRFLTSEKGLVRIKVYSPAGQFESVVAVPEKFRENGKAPALAVDGQGNVLALDIDNKMVRFFNPL